MEKTTDIKNKTKKKYVFKKKILSNSIEMETDPDFDKMILVKRWKIQFFKKKHLQGCIRKSCECFKPVRFLERHLKKNEILIHSNYKGEFLFGKIDRDKFPALLEKNRAIFETIYSNSPRRLYIDVDGTNSECLTKAKEVLYKIFGKDIKMSVSGSVGEKRGTPFYSYHIVLPNIVFKNLEEMKTSGFHEFIKSQADPKINGIDTCVYGNTQQFKAINQSKHKSDRIQKVIENDNVEEHIIQVFNKPINAMNYKNKFSQHIKFEIKKTNLKAYKAGKKTGITGFSLKHIKPLRHVVIPNIDFEFDKAIYILNQIPNFEGDRKLGRNIMWCVMNWFYHEEGESETAFKIFQKWEKPEMRITPQTFKSWQDCKNSEKWWGRQKIQHLLEKLYGCGLPNTRLDTFNKQFITGEIKGVTNTKCKTKYINMDDIGDEKYCVMKLGMGKGKTYTCIEWLIKECIKNPDLKICWITNRISMALNLMDRLNGNNEPTKVGEYGRDLEFQNYKDVGKSGFGGNVQKNNKYHLIRNEVGRIVIELESLHYSAGTCATEWGDGAEGMQYDIVIIDEIESVFNSFRSDKTHGNGLFYDNNYHRFEEIIKNASKVFLMDAYLHHRTIDYINILEPNNTLQSNINLIQADDDTIDKVINNHQSFYSWYNKLVEDIKAGKKIYVFFPFKTGKGSIQKLSIDGLKERLMNNCDCLEGGDVLVYHGDMSDKEKQKLSKVNDVWQKAKVVITNSCISVGVNYDLDDFDKVYLSYSDILNPRDVIQSSFRVRKTKEDIIEFYRFPNLFKILAKKKGIVYEPHPINKPKLEKNTDGFVYMRDFLLEEFNAKGHETLKKFFAVTGYIINNKWIGGDSDPIQYKNYDGGTMGVWDWGNINTITKKDKEEKERKIYDNNATIEDKLEVRKWYNDVAFKNRCFQDEKGEWKNDDNLNYVRQTFYERPMYLDGFKAIWEDKGIMRHVLTLNDGEYQYNNSTLSGETKKRIEDYLHLSDLVRTGSEHNKRFMEQSDHVIKKKILIHYFGINIMKNRGNWEDRNEGEFDDKFTEWCDITKLFSKKIAPLSPPEKIIKWWRKIMKAKHKNMKMLQGICWLDDEDMSD